MSEAREVQPGEGSTHLAQNWCALKVLHDRIDARIERALQDGHEISVREFGLLEVLARQTGEHHLQMKEVAEAVALSQSATTRLVARLEERGLLARYICPTDRRGIYTEVSAQGRKLLELARPTNADALKGALEACSNDAELGPLVQVLLVPSEADEG